MSEEKRSGRPGSATTPPPGAEVAETIKAPGVRMDNAVIGRPAPMVDAGRVAQVAKPAKAESPEEKEHTWHRIEIDVGPSTDHIKINGQAFYQGHTYTVRDDLVPVLMETMYNTKMHEMVVKGQASPIGRRLQAGVR